MLAENPLPGLFLTALACLSLIGCNHRKPENDHPVRGFWSEKPAATWEQSLVTGNGTMGVLMMGQPIADTLILSHAKLYMPLHEPLPPVNSGVKLDTIREMMFAGKFAEASQYVVDLSHREGWEGKRWTDPFVPAFDVRIRMVGDTTVQDYERSVDFSSGMASAAWKGATGTFSKRVFASRTDTLVVISIRGSDKNPVNCRISLADRPKDNSWWQSLYNRTNRTTTISAEDGWIFYQAEFDQGWEGSVKGVAGVMKVINTGGSALPAGSDMVVKDAREVLLLIRVEPGFFAENYSGQALLDGLKEKVSLVKPDYSSLLSRHVKVHGELFSRVSLDLNGGADRDLSSEELLKRSLKIPVPALLEKSSMLPGIISCVPAESCLPTFRVSGPAPQLLPGPEILPRMEICR